MNEKKIEKSSGLLQYYIVLYEFMIDSHRSF